jgi:hypothetical protein
MHFIHSSFARVHRTHKTTPAIAAGPTDHAPTIREMITLLDLDGSQGEPTRPTDA